MVGPIMNLITKTHYYIKRMKVIPKILKNYSRESDREKQKFTPLAGLWGLLIAPSSNKKAYLYGSIMVSLMKRNSTN
jgi:hypothetical protein